MVDYPGNRLFLETDALDAATCEANRAAGRDRSYDRVCCPWCGAADGWEEWDRWQVRTVRDSILLAFAVWLVSGERIKWYPVPQFYHRDDADHLYVPCWSCRPPTDGAVAVSTEAVQEWLEGER